MDVYASHQHYADHIAPVAALLPADLDVALVAGYGDVVAAKRAGHRRIVLMQHGAGQSYSNAHPNYPGGRRNDDVGLFLTPNAYSADLWRRAYPSASVAVVGCPKLDTLPTRSPKRPWPVVAFTFHFDLHMVPETQSAFAFYRDAIADVRSEFHVIGTAHPRRHDLAYFYDKAGIEFVPDFRDVCRRADVLAFDNTSAGYEFASTGRPVVVMDSPTYRKDVHHGLRFWDAADVGVRVGAPSDLLPAIRRSLEHRPGDIAAREDALETVYTYRHGAAQRAADAIKEWAG